MGTFYAYNIDRESTNATISFFFLLSPSSFLEISFLVISLKKKKNSSVEKTEKQRNCHVVMSILS